MHQEDEKGTFPIGTRRSPLAVSQARQVLDKLQAEFPDFTFVMKTQEALGDRNPQISLDKFNVTSVFARDLEALLSKKRLRVAVHSLKDLACQPVQDLEIRAYLNREDPRDCVVVSQCHRNKHEFTLDSLEPGCIVGTSSPRRASFIKWYYPHLKIKDIRGNIQTRIAKLDAGNYDAIVLAVAGLNRLNYQDLITQIIPLEKFLPSPGQGCIAVQCRSDDEEAISMLQRINDKNSEICCVAERSFMESTMAGCSVPLGAYAQIEIDDKAKAATIKLNGIILSKDGKESYYSFVEEKLIYPVYNCAYSQNLELSRKAGINLKDKLRDKGASELLSLIRKNT